MLLTRLPLTPKSALDLHVLSLPPAFVLSQDQTLKLRSSISALVTLGSLIARLGTERSELTRTYTPERQPKPAPKVTILETCPPMSMCGSKPAEADPEPRTSPPTFLFLLIQMSKSRSRNRSWFFSDQPGVAALLLGVGFRPERSAPCLCCVPRPRSAWLFVPGAAPLDRIVWGCQQLLSK